MDRHAFYFSTEIRIDGGPVRVDLIERKIINGRKAFLVRTSRKIAEYGGYNEFLLVPKRPEDSWPSADKVQPVFVYVLKYENYIKTPFSHGKNQKIIDWGGISSSDEAEKWALK